MTRHPATMHLLTQAIELATANQFYADSPLDAAVTDIIAATEKLDLWLIPSLSTQEH